MDIPPPHPILVNFTAALFPVSVISDLLGVLLRKESLRITGWWTLLFAALVTPFTALAGWFWMRSFSDMDHGEMVVHQWLGVSLAAAFVVLAWWRWRLYRGENNPDAVYMIAAIVIAIALVIQGHLGGIMSFGTASSSAPAPELTVNEHGHQQIQRNQWKDHLDLNGSE